MYVLLPAARPRAMSFTAIMLPAGIEDLREKREAINREILKDEEEKAKIQKVRTFMHANRLAAQAAPVTFRRS